jgi:transposase
LDADVVIWVGLDLHKENWHATIGTSELDLKSTYLPGNWESLQQLLAPFKDHPVVAAYEAGCFGFGLYDQLVAYGASCLVAPPSLIPRESGNRVKTDRLDSRKLKGLLAKGMLKAVSVPTVLEREHREVMRQRHRLLKDRVRMQVRIKSWLLLHSLQEWQPKHWSRAEIAHLHELRLPNRWMQESFASMLAEYEYLAAAVSKQTWLLRALAKTTEYRERANLLRSVPGVGVIVAMEFLLEIQDVSRFPRGEQLAAYVGLTPCQHSSGPNVHMGPITGIGKHALRQYLVEASWTAIGKDAGLREKYERIKERRGAKRAIVAVAHTLLLRMRRILLDGVPYEAQPAATAATTEAELAA